jgi:hypothetical protein
MNIDTMTVIAGVAEIKVKLNIESDKVKRCIKELIESETTADEFAEAVLQVWNQGLFRMTSFSAVVELIKARFDGRPLDAYDYVLMMSSRVDPEELLLAKMLMFNFLYEAYPLEDVLASGIPDQYKRRLLSLFIDLFHVDSIAYNNLYKISNPSPCPYEDALIRNVRRIALSWLTVPVYVFDSRKRYRCVATNMILDIGRFPVDREIAPETFNQIIAGFHGENFGGSFDLRDLFEIMHENTFAFDGCGIIGLPCYTERGLQATQVYVYKPNTDGTKVAVESKYGFVLSGKEDKALDILYSLCTKGYFNETDESRHGAVSSMITKRVSVIFSFFPEVRIAKERHGAWRLVNTRTKTHLESFPLVLYFPLVKNRTEK